MISRLACRLTRVLGTKGEVSVLLVCFTLWLSSQQLLVAVEPREIAAKVGPDGISVGEVTREMRTALGNRELSSADRQVLQAQTLGLLVNRQLVIQYLESTKQGVTREQVDAEVQHVEGQLKRRDKTLEDQLKELGISNTEFRRSLAWELGWPEYLRAKMTSENIRKYFEQHHREFDGTQLHVAHILLKVAQPDDPADVDRVAEKAEQLRTDINAGKHTFAEAAKQFSEAPTANAGGDIGLISRHEPMPEAFGEAAFELKKGETSEPVITTFGVHLIHMLAEQPGQLTLAEPKVHEAVREDLIRYLFLWISEKQRMEAKIVFTGALPYFDPSSGKLTTIPQRPAIPK